MAGGRQEKLPETLSRGFRARWTAGKDTWNAFAEKPCQVDSKRCYLTRFRGDSVPGGRQEETPGTLSRGFRARWTARRDTWNTFTGKPWQGDGRKSYLERFRGDSVPGGQREKTPGTLLQEYRARWTVGKATWNAFAGIPCQVDGGEETPGTLLQEYRARWTVGKATWNAFAGIPCQVGRREVTPGTLSREYRARGKAGRCHLEHSRRKTVPGGRQEKLPGTLSQEFRARWTARRDTWNTFTGKPWQGDGGEETPGTLSQENRGRGTAGKATWNAFAGIPCQVEGGERHLER